METSQCNKKRSRLCPSNCRPLSLTSIPCKIMERIFFEKVMEHLVSKNLLFKQQHGFIKGKSCTTNLLDYLDIINAGIANGKSIDVLYTDFSKAFDKVSKVR